MLRSLLKERQRVTRLAVEGGWVVAGQAASVLGALMLVRVLTDRLTPAQYGILALALTIYTLVVQVLIGPISAAIGRFYSVARDQESIPKFLEASRHWGMAASILLIFAALILIGALRLSGQAGLIPLVLASLFLSLISGLNSFFNSMHNAARRRAIVALHSAVDSWLKVILAALLITWLGPDPSVVIAGFVLSVGAVVVSQAVITGRWLSREVFNPHQLSGRTWRNDFLRFAWPIGLTGIFNWGYYASQRWGLEAFESTATVGKFAALTQIGYTPVALAGAMAISFLAPIIYDRDGGSSDPERLVRTQRLLFALAAMWICGIIAIAALVAAVHPVVFRVMVAEEYQSVSGYLPAVVFSAGILSASQILAILLMARNLTKELIPLNVIGNGAIGLLNFTLTSAYGLNGLVVSMLVGSGLHLGWMCLLLYLHGPKRPAAVI
jgi:O-antigen/teichoic acid export membrane protein